MRCFFFVVDVSQILLTNSKLTNSPILFSLAQLLCSSLLIPFKHGLASFKYHYCHSASHDFFMLPGIFVEISRMCKNKPVWSSSKFNARQIHLKCYVNVCRFFTLNVILGREKAVSEARVGQPKTIVCCPFNF